MSEYNPTDGQITNIDSAVTNTDDSNDDSLGKEEQSTEQKKSDDERVPTVTPDNDNSDTGAPADESSSNKGQGPSGENL